MMGGGGELEPGLDPGWNTQDPEVPPTGTTGTTRDTRDPIVAHRDSWNPKRNSL